MTSCVTLFPLRSLKKAVVGYIDIKQQETYEKLKNRGWYSKWYRYFINAITTDDNNNDENTPASTVTATAITNESNNNYNNYSNNNVILIKINNKNKNEKWFCIKTKKRLKVVTDIVCLISYPVKKKKNAP